MTFAIEIDLPADLARFHMPDVLADRLQELLDRQDSGTSLTPKDRKEAQALIDVSELFALLRLRSNRPSGAVKTI